MAPRAPQVKYDSRAFLALLATDLLTRTTHAALCALFQRKERDRCISTLPFSVPDELLFHAYRRTDDDDEVERSICGGAVEDRSADIASSASIRSTGSDEKND